MKIQIKDERFLLFATRSVDNRVLGIDPSKKTGGAGEYQYSREWQPGDSMRQIDWRSFATIGVSPPVASMMTAREPSSSPLIGVTPWTRRLPGKVARNMTRLPSSRVVSVVAALPDRLQSGDLLVVNNTRVFAARLLGRRDAERRGGRVPACYRACPPVAPGERGAEEWRSAGAPGAEAEAEAPLSGSKEAPAR